MESVGFKEWAIVCEAIGRGEQSIILRKGGIAEGRDGFAFRHAEFFLFPTFFHEQIEQGASEGRGNSEAREGEIEIRFFAKLEPRDGRYLMGDGRGAGAVSYFAANRSCASGSITRQRRAACGAGACLPFDATVDLSRRAGDTAAAGRG